MDFTCAAGCGETGVGACETLSVTPVPPSNWVTLGLDVASAEAPYMSRDGRYSAIVCSVDCAIAFLHREQRIMRMAASHSVLSTTVGVKHETRSDIARRIGALVIEASEEMMEMSDKTIVLPLDKETFQLSTDVALAFLLLTPEMQETTE